MAVQPPATGLVLSIEDLARLKHRLAMFSHSSFRDFYNDAYARCALCSDRIPEPSAIQELVQAWKLLRNPKRWWSHEFPHTKKGASEGANSKADFLVPEVGLERRQHIDNTQVIDFRNGTIATISWFGGKLVRIEDTARVNFRISTSLHTAALRRFADYTAK